MLPYGANRDIRKAIVTAAGKGSRLLPLTKAVPKELIPLGTKPVLEHIVEEITQSGITEILFVISPDKTAIRSHFGDSSGSVRFCYTFQEEQKGLADAVLCGRDFTGDDSFAVVLGDSLIYSKEPFGPFQRVLDAYRGTWASGVIAVQRTPMEEVSRYGIVQPIAKTGPRFEISGLVEKPRPGKAPSDYAIAGRYAFEASIYDCIERTKPGANGELQLTDSIAIMLADAKPVWCVALSSDETRRDIGTFPSYFEAFQLEIDKHRPV